MKWAIGLILFTASASAAANDKPATLPTDHERSAVLDRLSKSGDLFLIDPDEGGTGRETRILDVYVQGCLVLFKTGALTRGLVVSEAELGEGSAITPALSGDHVQIRSAPNSSRVTTIRSARSIDAVTRSLIAIQHACRSDGILFPGT